MSLLIAPTLVVAVLLLMLVEAQLSNHNERLLRARGAIEPPDDVIHLMRLAYPLSFVCMGVEGLSRGALDGWTLFAGLSVFTIAKALKFWAIASLGVRWSFKVLVLPGAPLVASGPYRVLRHPNYVAVTGELVGVAIALAAPITGALGTLGFLWLMRRRVQIEERALGIRR